MSSFRNVSTKFAAINQKLKVKLNPISFNRLYASSSDVPPDILAKLNAMQTILTTPTTTSDSPRMKKNSAKTPTTNTSTTTTSRHADASVICHELDSHGILHVHGGKFQKSAICSNLGLQARDLRRLDGTLKDQLPIILIRDSSILISIDYIRAIVKHDGVILFEDVMDMEQRMKQYQFLLFLQSRLKTSSSTVQNPFEFIVLETMLQRTLQALQEEFDGIQPEIEEHMRALESIVHWERLKVLLIWRKRLAMFLERVNNIRTCIKELLESDADMADMYLSYKFAAKDTDRPASAHEEIEWLLESYLKIAEEIASRTQVLVSNMQATEDIVNIALVGQRNELVLLDLRLGIGTFAVSMGAFGASILGMNLHTGFETSNTAFWLVLGTIISVSSTSFTLVWRRMLRLIHYRK